MRLSGRRWPGRALPPHPMARLASSLTGLADPLDQSEQLILELAAGFGQGRVIADRRLEPIQGRADVRGQVSAAAPGQDGTVRAVGQGLDQPWVAILDRGQVLASLELAG